MLGKYPAAEDDDTRVSVPLKRRGYGKK